MKVLEFETELGGASVTRVKQEEWVVEVWLEDKMFKLERKKSFQEAEDFYWKMIKEELI